MGKVTSGFSMSLDGFVADAKDGVDEVFRWYITGTADREVTTGDTTFRFTSEGADMIEQAGRVAGVLVTARRTFDVSRAWGGKHPMDVPVVVVTHAPPQEWVDREGSPFTFVTDGIPSAIETARRIAGDKDVVVGAPSVLQQCLQLGLLDEIHIDLVPVLLGAGVRLFADLPATIRVEVVETSGNSRVTHLTYRVTR